MLQWRVDGTASKDDCSAYLNCLMPVPGKFIAFSKTPRAVSYCPELYKSRPTCRKRAVIDHPVNAFETI